MFKWNTPGGGSKQIRNEKIGFRLYDTGTITLCGPKVEEYNEKLRDIAQEYKLDQQDQARPANVSVDERLLNVADDLFGESVAQAESSVCEIVNDEVASELVCALPLKHSVNDIQIQLNTLKHAFERYRSEASIVLTDLISNQSYLAVRPEITV
jgi:hypothetical protein